MAERAEAGWNRRLTISLYDEGRTSFVARPTRVPPPHQPSANKNRQRLKVSGWQSEAERLLSHIEERSLSSVDRENFLFPMKGPHMEITNFKDMYLSELQELASVESQLADSLLHMAEVASHPALKNALLHHREETQVQKDRLESILQKHGANPKAHTDQAMQALLKETGKMLTMLKGNDPSRCGAHCIGSEGGPLRDRGIWNCRSPRRPVGPARRSTDVAHESRGRETIRRSADAACQK